MDYYAWEQLLQGAWATAWISAVSIVLGVVIGLAIALIRMMKIPFVDQMLGIYVSWARATPLVTLALFIFLSFPSFGINLDKHVSAILALTLNTSAFNAEIWRNAFLNFSKGQMEAAEAIGMR
ncbi:ABC transporter permease subunit, partial [Vibrio sp. 10N.222.49.E5]